MGQATSRNDVSSTPPPSRRRRARLSSMFTQHAGSSLDENTVSRPSPRNSRASLIEPLSRFREDFTTNRLASHTSPRFGIDRSRSRLSNFSRSLSRHLPNRRRHSRSPSTAFEDPSDLPELTSIPTFELGDPRYLHPNMNTPDPDSGIDEDAGEPEIDSSTRSNRRHVLRSASSLSDRFSSFRPDRGIRNVSSSLRRRRSPLARDEDQVAWLSRILSFAAAATAASLVNGDRRAVAEARGVLNGGEDGTFEGFLRNLQSGGIADAFRQNEMENGNEAGSEGNTQAPLNFVRMFRFGSQVTPRNHSSRGSAAGANRDAVNGEEGNEGRMVPIIIVGIRSIGPDSSDETSMLPFLDALSPQATPSNGGDVANDGILRQPQHGTRITHRRRASMSGVGSSFPANYDSQRHQRTPERVRPLSTSDSTTGPRPPPSTPASAGLSAFSSAASTPTTSSPSLAMPSDMASRRSSFAPRSSTSGLDGPVEEPSTQQRPSRRRRRLSEPDYQRHGSGSWRRNGVVGPDAPPDSGSEDSRSWIIYVLGGSYPEGHPILTTPSLFTDTPSYEDMMLLSALLGPVKPPVASAEDVASAPGLLKIIATDGNLLAVAIAVDGSSEASELSIALGADDHCQVCLSEYEAGEEARMLMSCGHLFHRVCIDQWLTTGRNSCPLCRGQGVDDTSGDQPPTAREQPSSPVIAASSAS